MPTKKKDHQYRVLRLLSKELNQLNRSSDLDAWQTPGQFNFFKVL